MSSWRRVCSVLLLLTVAAGEPPCERLAQQWPHRYADMPVQVHGAQYPVRVRGAGAAAALAAAVLRHALGYRAEHDPAPLDLCRLAPDSAPDLDWAKTVVVGAAARCARPNNATKTHYDKITDFTASDIPSTIYLLAHVPSQRCTQYLTNTTFYYNSTILGTCGFIKNNEKEMRDCRSCFLVLAKNENEQDVLAARELQRRIEHFQLPLQLVYHATATSLRKKMSLLQNETKAFLFLYEDIWSDTGRFYHVRGRSCPHISTCSVYSADNVRVGNGFIMRTRAPAIHYFVNQFKPGKEDLRQILDYQTFTNSTEEDAACLWAAENTLGVQRWLPARLGLRVYDIKVVLCEDDPDLQEYLEVASSMYYILNHDETNFKYNLSKIIIKCNSGENNLSDLIDRMKAINKIAGAVVWTSAMTDSAAAVAAAWDFLMVLAGNRPAVEPRASSAAFLATTPPLWNITNAYLELFSLCGWSRVAVLSDESSYSKTFIEPLLKSNKLLYREGLVNLTNIDEILDEFHYKDARIFFVNTDWNVAGKVLCTGLKKGMTPAANFMWIVREWRAVNCSEEGSSSMYHFTIGASWRGGPTSGGSQELRSIVQNSLSHQQALVGAAGSASLADAILLFARGFYEFIQKYPTQQFELRGNGNAEKFSKIVNELSINGTAQDLKRRRNETLVFLEKWNWTKGESIALWYVTPAGILKKRPNETVTCDTLLGSRPPDREYCHLKSGDEFAPRCHVVTVFVVVILLIFTVAALCTARRVRLSNLRRRNEEERQRIFSSLDGYLIKRNSIRLLHVIGSGSNGVVRFAELKKPSEILAVAAKEPHDGISIFEVNEFLHEACVLASLRHDNVIRLVGICIGDGPPIILMEHAFYNDLKKYLILRRQFAKNAELGENCTEEASEVSDSELTRFAREAARALDFLAQNRLLHRDVRAANCLVNKSRTLKLADFGMARELDCESSLYMATCRRLFPILWMPPESLHKGVFSTASDVWALGVLILEIATLGARPYVDWPVEKVLQYVKSGGHPPLPPDTSKHTRNIVLACWRGDETSRPSARIIHQYLKRHPNAISPALLTPDLPSSLSNHIFIKTEDKNEDTCSLSAYINDI